MIAEAPLFSESRLQGLEMVPLGHRPFRITAPVPVGCPAGSVFPGTPLDSIQQPDSFLPDQEIVALLRPERVALEMGDDESHEFGRPAHVENSNWLGVGNFRA